MHFDIYVTSTRLVMASSLKIYFAGSIQGGRQDVALYKQILDQLKLYGEVHPEVVARPGVEKEELGKCMKTIHDENMKWLKDCDVLIAECTQPSLGVGYEIGRAINLNKKILCLFRPESGRNLSAMIRGAENGTTLTCKDYRTEDLPEILKNFLETIKCENYM